MVLRCRASWRGQSTHIRIRTQPKSYTCVHLRQVSIHEALDNFVFVNGCFFWGGRGGFLDAVCQTHFGMADLKLGKEQQALTTQESLNSDVARRPPGTRLSAPRGDLRRSSSPRCPACCAPCSCPWPWAICRRRSNQMGEPGRPCLEIRGDLHLSLVWVL